MAYRMVSKTNFLIVFTILIRCVFSSCDAQKVPAMYLFGDSLVDVGTNNYLPLSLAKANFPHNGVDYPGQEATGRFSNGKNSADLLAEKIGLPTSPPYLSLATLTNKLKGKVSFPITGVSFASGGAGIFDIANPVVGQTVSMSKQIEQFTCVYTRLVQDLGLVGARNHLSKSLFYVTIGNNDLIGYFSRGSDLPRRSTPQQFINSMAATLKLDLKKIYSFGARKFVISSVGSIGCTPAFRNQNKEAGNVCNEEANKWVVQYNEGLKSMLHDLKNLELRTMNYSYVDIFAMFTSFLQNPTTYGFTELQSACCGLGNLRAEVPCLPTSELCPDRTNHAFWDLYHPTETSNRIFIDTIYNGSLPYTLPINVEQLVNT